MINKMDRRKIFEERLKLYGSLHRSLVYAASSLAVLVAGIVSSDTSILALGFSGLITFQAKYYDCEAQINFLEQRERANRGRF